MSTIAARIVTDLRSNNIDAAAVNDGRVAIYDHNECEWFAVSPRAAQVLLDRLEDDGNAYSLWCSDYQGDVVTADDLV